MTNLKIKDPKAICCIVFSTLFGSAVIILFILGGIFFGTEHPKVLNYASSRCLVGSQSTKTYKCSTRYSRYTCYGAIWNVYHGENLTTFAIVEEDQRYRSPSDALKRARHYHVSIYSQ